MGRLKPARRLIVNADDFGKSSEINRAVIEAYQRGILTSASLMVNEPGLAEAVDLAKANPGLGIGLHLTLLCGHAAIRDGSNSILIDPSGAFKRGPVASGWQYFFTRGLRQPLRLEIAAQFRKFFDTGLALDHVNGHLHMHLHPTVFNLLLESPERTRITHMRLTRDPLGLNLRLASGRWFYRLSRWLIYQCLAQRAEKLLQNCQIRFPDRVFGLLQDSRVNRDFLRDLLRRLPLGDSELYSHPSLTDFKHEFEALVDPVVKQLIRQENIELIQYKDL